MKKLVTEIGKFFLFLIISAVCALLVGVIVMWLWNWLMPTLFGLTTITWIQGWGITFLCGVLFRQRITMKDKE